MTILHANAEKSRLFRNFLRNSQNNTYILGMIRVSYKGDLRTESRSEGRVLLTDGPTEFHGKGEYYSPTDLLAISLASCVLTLMGIAARKMGKDLGATVADVEKEMASGVPRRIGRISVKVRSPLNPSSEERSKLEQAALTCPVHASLHPDIKQEITFEWGAF